MHYTFKTNNYTDKNLGGKNFSRSADLAATEVKNPCYR